MEQKKAKFPIGASTALMQSDESMSSYLGLTREQKREILTHSLLGGQQQSALLSGNAPMHQTEPDDRMRTE